MRFAQRRFKRKLRRCLALVAGCDCIGCQRIWIAWKIKVAGQYELREKQSEDCQNGNPKLQSTMAEALDHGSKLAYLGARPLDPHQLLASPTQSEGVTRAPGAPR